MLDFQEAINQLAKTQDEGEAGTLAIVCALIEQRINLQAISETLDRYVTERIESDKVLMGILKAFERDTNMANGQTEQQKREAVAKKNEQAKERQLAGGGIVAAAANVPPLTTAESQSLDAMEAAAKRIEARLEAIDGRINGLVEIVNNYALEAKKAPAEEPTV